MRRWKRLVAAGAVAGLALGGTGVGVAAAQQAYPINDNQDWVRIGGSDTTYYVMDALSTLYNESPGCKVIVPTGGTQNLDGKCADQDLVTAGKQIGYELDGAGNVAGDANTNVNANPDHDMAFNAYPVGSSLGITQLTNRGTAGYQVIDVARSSRARRGTDDVNLRFFAYAKDAIPWVKFPGTPAAAVSDLSTVQLTDIFNGCSTGGSGPGGLNYSIDTQAAHQVTIPGTASTQNYAAGNSNGAPDWGDIGGTTGDPLVVWAAQSGSGTRSAYDGFLGSGANSTNCIPSAQKDGSAANGERVIFENDATPIIASGLTNCPEVAAVNPGATSCAAYSIFYYSLGRYSESGGETSILGNINTIAPSETTITNDTYLYSRFVFNVIRNTDAANAVRNFTAARGFLCKPASEHITNPLTKNNYRTDIENTIRAKGFFPIPLGTTGLGLANSHCRAS